MCSPILGKWKGKQTINTNIPTQNQTTVMWILMDLYQWHLYKINWYRYHWTLYEYYLWN